jgi:hypothetical protein
MISPKWPGNGVSPAGPVGPGPCRVGSTPTRPPTPSHTLVSRTHTCFSLLPSLARCAAALLCLFADHLRRGCPCGDLHPHALLHPPIRISPSGFPRSSPTSKPSGHQSFWLPPAAPSTADDLNYETWSFGSISLIPSTIPSYSTAISLPLPLSTTPPLTLELFDG